MNKIIQTAFVVIASLLAPVSFASEPLVASLYINSAIYGAPSWGLPTLPVQLNSGVIYRADYVSGSWFFNGPNDKQLTLWDFTAPWKYGDNKFAVTSDDRYAHFFVPDYKLDDNSGGINVNIFAEDIKTHPYTYQYSQQSSTGSVLYLGEQGYKLTTGSPVWTDFNFASSSPFDVLSLDFGRLDINGLLSVYLDGILLQTISGNDTSAQGNLDHYLIGLLGQQGAGTHTLRLYLESSTNTPASVILSGINGPNYGTAAVPIPGTIWMFSSGLLGLIGSWKRIPRRGR